MKRRPLVFMGVVALGIGMAISVGIVERSKRVRSGRDSEFQGRHSSAFEVALLLVPRTGRRWL